MLFIVVLIAGGIIWISRSSKSDDNSEVAQEVIIDSISSTEAVPEYVASDYETTEEATEDSVEVPEPVEEEYSGDRSTTVYVPSAERYTSSEAYDIYPEYIPDERLGDDWKASESVQRAIRNGDIECMIKGEGEIQTVDYYCK